MAVYNTSRFIEGLLKTTESSPPSFTVRLYREYWTLNNGSKFLYNNQVASLLDDIRTRHIPVDFLELFDTAKLPFYEGCLIVELHDFRPAKTNDPDLDEPDKTRVVLTPNDESRWADICLMTQKTATPWSDAEALELEARLLVSRATKWRIGYNRGLGELNVESMRRAYMFKLMMAPLFNANIPTDNAGYSQMTTAPPLCLEPDVHLTRMVNATQRATTPPAPPSLKRKASAMDQEADEVEKARRVKLSQYMNPRTRTSAQTYRILDAIERAKAAKERASAAASTQPTQPAHINPPSTASPRPPTTAPVPVAPAPAPTPAAAPMQYQHPTAAPSPAPVVAGTPPMGIQDPKKQGKRNSIASQSPLIPQASAAPSPNAPTGGSRVPPHLLQQYQAQLAQRAATSSPAHAASPRPPPASAVAHASSPAAAPTPEQRPPSVVPATPVQKPAQPAQPVPQVQQMQPQVQQVAQPAARVQPSPAPGHTPQPQSQPQLPPNAYPAQMLIAQQHQAIARRKAAAAAAAAAGGATPNVAGGAVPNGQQPMQNYAQYMAYQAHLHAQQQQRVNQAQTQAQAQNKTASPAARSPMPAAQVQAAAAAAAQAQRNSPMVANRTLATRSPMPSAAQQPVQIAQAQAQAQAQQKQQQQQQQQQSQQQQPRLQAQPVAQAQAQAQGQAQHPAHPQHPTQHSQHPQHAQYAQYYMRQVQPQMQPHLAAAGGAQGGMQAAQAQAQMMQQYYNYARMPGVAMGQLPAAYWQQLGAGRGMPVQQMPGMPGHPQQQQQQQQQQMQPGAGGGKPPQGGQQGS